MQVHTAILEPVGTQVPDWVANQSWCQLRSNLALAAVPFGEILRATPVAPTVIGVNMGWPFCTQSQEFVGCWPIKTEQLEIAIINNALENAPSVAPYSGDVSWWVRMTFEYANAGE
jgi:hypothetical protein